MTPPELGAAIHAFDKDGDGCISCPEFLRTFFRLGEKVRALIKGVGGGEGRQGHDWEEGGSRNHDKGLDGRRHLEASEAGLLWREYRRKVTGLIVTTVACRLVLGYVFVFVAK